MGFLETCGQNWSEPVLRGGLITKADAGSWCLCWAQVALRPHFWDRQPWLVHGGPGHPVHQETLVAHWDSSVHQSVDGQH